MQLQVPLISVITDKGGHLHHKCSWTSLVFFPPALLQWCVSNAICVCHVAWTGKQTDYSSECVSVGAAGQRLCLVSCCHSGGQVAHACHSPPLILSSFLLSLFPISPVLLLRERVWRGCFKTFTLIFFLLFLCPSPTDIDVQRVCAVLLRCSYAHTLHAAALVRAWGDGETNRDEWHTHTHTPAASIWEIKRCVTCFVPVCVSFLRVRVLVWMYASVFLRVHADIRCRWHGDGCGSAWGCCHGNAVRRGGGSRATAVHFVLSFVCFIHRAVRQRKGCVVVCRNE